MTRPNFEPSSEKENLGFLNNGYLFEIDEISPENIAQVPPGKVPSGKPGTLGGATYFTATAVIALATGNYKPGTWESQDANEAISKFLDVLEYKSWANTDFRFEEETPGGDEHPIRYPAWKEWDKSGRMSFAPLALVANDSDIGYIVWSFAIELECQPPLISVLMPSIATIWGTIANRGNPNGVWAWLVGEQSSVDAQMDTFKTSHLNHWKAYAYTKHYGKWLKDSVTDDPNSHGPAASRLDCF